jgi:hypothetical protein
MPLHFAASRLGENAFVARMLTAPAVVRSANDNGRPIGEMLSEPSMLRFALLHFARHGLAAAEHARNNAEAAFTAGDEEQYRHWLAVCRLLDRRMAHGTMERLDSLVPQLPVQVRATDRSLARR